MQLCFSLDILLRALCCIVLLGRYVWALWFDDDNDDVKRAWREKVLCFILNIPVHPSIHQQNVADDDDDGDIAYYYYIVPVHSLTHILTSLFCFRNNDNNERHTQKEKRSRYVKKVILVIPTSHHQHHYLPRLLYILRQKISFGSKEGKRSVHVHPRMKNIG